MPDSNLPFVDEDAPATAAEAAVRDWILGAWKARNGTPLPGLGRDEELIESRIIDSLSLMNLIHFLEELAEREIPVAGIDIDSFRTLRRIGETYLQGAAA